MRTLRSRSGLFAVAAIAAAKINGHDLGLFRMVQGNLFGPAQLLAIGAECVFLPHLVLSNRRVGTSGLDEAARYSAIMAAVIATYGVTLLAIARPVLQ